MHDLIFIAPCLTLLAIGCAEPASSGPLNQLVPIGRDAQLDTGHTDAQPDEDLGLANDAALIVDRDSTLPDADMGIESLPDAPNSGWIGGPCAQDADCEYPEGYCLTEADGYPDGMCSQDCERLCPDRDETPSTFCVGGVVIGSGACIQQCDYDAFGRTGCRPGYHCENETRYNEERQRQVCKPGEPPEQPYDECYDELDRLGLTWAVWNVGVDTPAGNPELMCTIDGPNRLSSPINGVNYRYVSHDEPRPLRVSCELAIALHQLSELLRSLDVVEVGHIGTYNCRVIGGTDTLSEHGHARAIDLKWFRTSDGQVYDVEDHWEHDTLNFRTDAGRWLYTLGQEMSRRRIFNIILTPNYNAAHDNHFHVDMTPGANFIGAPGGGSYIGPNIHGD